MAPVSHNHIMTYHTIYMTSSHIPHIIIIAYHHTPSTIITPPYAIKLHYLPPDTIRHHPSMPPGHHSFITNHYISSHSITYHHTPSHSPILIPYHHTLSTHHTLSVNSSAFIRRCIHLAFTSQPCAHYQPPSLLTTTKPT